MKKKPPSNTDAPERPEDIDGYEEFEPDFGRALRFALMDPKLAGDLRPEQRHLGQVIGNHMPKNGGPLLIGSRNLADSTGMSKSRVGRALPGLRIWKYLNVTVPERTGATSSYATNITKDMALAKWREVRRKERELNKIASHLSGTLDEQEKEKPSHPERDGPEENKAVLEKSVPQNTESVPPKVGHTLYSSHTPREDTAVSSANQDQEEAQEQVATSSDGQCYPHMNGRAFVISEQHNLFVVSEKVEEWRERFPAIDVVSRMENLSSKILKGGPMHPGWGHPTWMAGPLSEENQKAVEAKRLADAKLEAAVEAERQFVEKRVQAYGATAEANRAAKTASPKSKGQKFKTDDLIAELAARHNVGATEVDWLRPLVRMRPLLNDPIEELDHYIEATKGKSAEDLSWATETAVKKCQLRPSPGVLLQAISYNKSSSGTKIYYEFDWATGKQKNRAGR